MLLAGSAWGRERCTARRRGVSGLAVGWSRNQGGLPGCRWRERRRGECGSGSVGLGLWNRIGLGYNLRVRIR